MEITFQPGIDLEKRDLIRSKAGTTHPAKAYPTDAVLSNSGAVKTARVLS
jgi:hypothetical protein